MTETVIATREIRAFLENGDCLVATAQLTHLHGNARPYFSATARLWESQGKLSGIARFKRGYEWDAGGCLHERIVAEFPELAPVVAVHLADDDGVPMHAASNGWYFYSGKARDWEESRPNETWHNRDGLTDVERAARALNIPAADVPAGMDREAFDAFVESLRPRWAEMAATARAVIDAE